VLKEPLEVSRDLLRMSKELWEVFKEALRVSKEVVESIERVSGSV
jgi:hypothetical protein